MALGTLETFAAYRGVDYDPTDIQAQLAVDAAAELVRTYCDQQFDLVEDDIITLDGTGTRSLLLPELPVLAVTEITVTDPDGVETALVATEDWISDDRNGILYRLNHHDIWPLGRQNVLVTYDHGYETLPSDLAGVILGVASRGLSSTSGHEVNQEQIGTYMVRYADIAGVGGLLDAERGVLDRYRQARLA